MYVEFLGVARERTGVAEVELDAATLSEALVMLAQRFPRFVDLLTDGRLHPSVAANLNTDTFVDDPATRFGKDDRLLLLSADAGG